MLRHCLYQLLSFATALPLLAIAVALLIKPTWHIQDNTFTCPTWVAGFLILPLIVNLLFWARCAESASVKYVDRVVYTDRLMTVETQVVVDRPMIMEVPVYVPVIVRRDEKATICSPPPPIAIGNDDSTVLEELYTDFDLIVDKRRG